MKRLLLSALVVLAAGAFLVVAGGATDNSNAVGDYTIQLDNAFGIVPGADFKVAGVKAGSIKSISLDANPQSPGYLRALVRVSVTEKGFGQFHSDVFCQSRPQSLIGEYFVECQPGQSGPVLKPGSTIPVTQTQSTIPADLVQNVMRMPYRQRFSLIINELGAGVAARSTSLQDALKRAVPALTQTDNLLNLLANDSHTLQDLTATADTVVTALADNSAQVQRFITQANNAATASAARSTDIQATFAKFPGFLEQLRPALVQLGNATDANTPVLTNLNNSAPQITRFLTDLPPFSRASLPALRSLGKASVTGKQAVTAVQQNKTIQHLKQFATNTPELAQNLAIVLHDLDDQGRAVEADPRSPGGKGFTGIEAILQYAFQQTLAINTFNQYSHVLALDIYTSSCSGFSSPGSVAQNLALSGDTYRAQCYSWLGPNQPGINEPDPTNPGACVPDPGGEPPGYQSLAPKTSVCKLSARDTASTASAGKQSTKLAAASPKASTAGRSPGSATSGGGSAGGSGRSGGSGSPLPPISLKGTIGQLLGLLGGKTANGSQPPTAAPAPQAGAPPANQTQQLLGYLLNP
jgi:virulence factor Mce-like protein